MVRYNLSPKFLLHLFLDLLWSIFAKEVGGFSFVNLLPQVAFIILQIFDYPIAFFNCGPTKHNAFFNCGPSNDLHFSHIISKLLTRTPHRHHWYSPSSIMSTFSLTPNIGPPFPSRQFELHPQSDERRRSTHGEFPPLFEFISVWQPHLTLPPIQPLF